MARMSDKVGDVLAIGHHTGVGGCRVKSEHDRSRLQSWHNLMCDFTDQAIGDGQENDGGPVDRLLPAEWS